MRLSLFDGNDNLPAFTCLCKNSSSRKLFSATRLASLVRMNSGYSSLRVSRQDGSRPTMGTPLSAYPASWSTFQAALFFASPSMPLEIIGRPQHRLLTNRSEEHTSEL